VLLRPFRAQARTHAAAQKTKHLQTSKRRLAATPFRPLDRLGLAPICIGLRLHSYPLGHSQQPPPLLSSCKFLFSSNEPNQRTMDDDPLEEKRTLHERRDRIEMAIVEEMLAKKSGHKEQLDSQHRQKRLLDKYMECSNQLLQLYTKDTDRPNRDGGINRACNEFYIEYNKICNRYDKSADDELIDVVSGTSEPLIEPSSLAVVLTSDLATTNESGAKATTEKLVEFTDEEGYGKYLDLNECYEAYLQVVKNDEVKSNYLNFIMKYDKFIKDLSRDRKLTPAYKSFVEKMLEYFRDYSRRARPLFDYKEMEDKTHESFLEQWRDKAVPGWFDKAEQDVVGEPMIELESYKSVEHLMELGLDCLKQELKVYGLKCGGTLEERARRLWSIRGKRPEEIDDSLKNNNSKKGKKKQVIDPQYIASVEAKLVAYTEYFNDHIQATIENVQRKQARTADERNESDDDDVSDVEDEESDQSNVIYNPKNLPLGWDGKPIPYWLYKLHGLNMTFTCEICGNATYKGPKAFQRHFAEQRHAHGMKCLGIPNTAHFANITSIQDAIKLWDKLKVEKQRDQFQPQVEEEYEDSQGNVVNKKIYEDLKRQGLL
jgi:splicing factor 3A subunit 3